MPFKWDTVYDYLDKKGLKPSSVQTYVAQMTRVFSGMFDKPNPSLTRVAKSLPKAIQWIKDNIESYTGQKNHLTSMLHFYNALDVNTEKLNDALNEVRELSTAERAGGLSEKKQKKFDNVDFDQLKKQVDDLPDGTKRLMLAVSAGFMPVLRNSEWRGTQVFKTKPANPPDNYILLNKKKMFVGDHKTVKTHGVKTIQLPSRIIDEVKRYMKHKDTNVLFDDMSSSQWTKLMERHFGFSTNTLRKKFVSGLDVTPEERLRISKEMGHTIATSKLDYDK